MGRGSTSLELAILLLLLLLTTFSNATRAIPSFRHGEQSMISLIRQMKKMRAVKNLDLLSSSNTEPYGVSSPLMLPPFESLPPIPLPDTGPPYCIFPPLTPQQPPHIPTPSTPYVYLPPMIPVQNPPRSPPESFPSPNPPKTFPRPPTPGSVPSSPIPRTTPIPSAPGVTPCPPIVTTPPFHIPSPPTFSPSPPSYVPSPGGGGIAPRPPVFHPPVIYPRPTAPPPPKLTPSVALWCVVKPSVPDPIVQEAMNYACGSGADCSSIQPEGPCFQPNTLFAHASYAFNSYWQRTKVAGGTCSFGGTAMLVTVDPSYDGCHFVYY
ncbi:hypothetical protein MLD38_008585 [Melastoma candidum]|uniref:Uncharacterized protein n=1 Tax=Melastoma candidum TaxID=119954 RepID=A0ACB9RUF5_9MYRT|nr:hypothetical protein MLD38_008585 [Melastoma candidum]